MYLKVKRGSPGGGKKPSTRIGAASDELVAGLLGALVITFVFLLFIGPLPWMIRSSSESANTYPAATILGKDAGGLDRAALSAFVSKIATSVDSRRFTLEHDGKRWQAAIADLGFAVDTRSTAQAVWKLNTLPWQDKISLVLHDGGGVVEPVLRTDTARCEQKVSELIGMDTVAVNAKLYYDTAAKVMPDVTGERLNPAQTCRLIQKAIKTDKYFTSAAVDTVPAGILASDITARLPDVVNMTGRAVTFTAPAFARTVNPDELLSFLTLAKEPGKPLSINWDETKLDTLAAEMAAHIDTFTTPALGNCEVLVSSGGTRLDRKAVKDAITSLNAGKPTTYALKTYGVTARTRSRTAVQITGTKGIVYLTYDDGMTFGGTIMNYAACYGIKVTFFEIGSRAHIDAALLQRAINEGHAVQSHGYTHAVKDYGTGHDYAWQFNDIKLSADVIAEVTGVRPTYFRPPGGNRTADTYAAAANNGLKLILWGVTSADTANNTSADICRNVLSGARAGYSVLMHSTKQKTANALPCIVEGLAARGYSMQALQ